MGQIEILCLLIGCNENTASLLWCSCQSRTLPAFNHKETSDKPKLKDVLQNNQPVISKSFKVMKINERLKNCSTIEGD